MIDPYFGIDIAFVDVNVALISFWLLCFYLNAAEHARFLQLNPAHLAYEKDGPNF